MSRALNIKLAEAQVLAKCRKAGVLVSAIEPLIGGGTHLVCTTIDGANEMRLQFKNMIITGAVQRMPFYSPQVRT
jgi:hypothetical protein